MCDLHSLFFLIFFLFWFLRLYFDTFAFPPSFLVLFVACPLFFLLSSFFLNSHFLQLKSFFMWWSTYNTRMPNFALSTRIRQWWWLSWNGNKFPKWRPYSIFRVRLCCLIDHDLHARYTSSRNRQQFGRCWRIRSTSWVVCGSDLNSLAVSVAELQPKSTLFSRNIWHLMATMFTIINLPNFRAVCKPKAM